MGRTPTSASKVMDKYFDETIGKVIVEKVDETLEARIQNILKRQMIFEKSYRKPDKIKIYVSKIGENEKLIEPINKIQHKKFNDVLKLISMKLNVLLVGEAGSGKNVIAEEVAHFLSIPFYPVQKISQEFSLTGYKDAGGNYHTTSFRKAFEDGGLFFLDEMDASSPEAIIVLNAALANGYFDFPDKRVNAHEKFVVIAGANTLGYGASDNYTSRQAIDEATLDRFETIIVEYDENIELALCGNNEKIYEIITSTRQLFKERGIEKIISPRTSKSIYKMICSGDFTLEQAYKIRVLSKLNSRELELIENANQYLSIQYKINSFVL